MAEELEEMANKDFALPSEEEYERAIKVRAELDRQFRERIRGLLENAKTRLGNENKT